MILPSLLIGEASGASVDYTYIKLGIEYSFGIELRDLGDFGTRLPADQIIPNAEESLEAIKVSKYKSASKYLSLFFTNSLTNKQN